MSSTPTPSRARPGLPVLLAACLLAGCGGPASRVLLSIQLSDDAFCPGGVLAGHDAPEKVRVRLGIRSRDARVVELSAYPVELKVYPRSEPTEVRVRKRIEVDMQVGETWQTPLDDVHFLPPEEQGRYMVEVSGPDGAWDSTPLEVWYDEQACPRAAAGATPLATPPTSIPSASPTPATTPPARRTALEAALFARWHCNEDRGVEDLEVRVRVSNPDRPGRAVRGYRPVVQGIDELDPFERVSGEPHEGYLPPGQSLEYRAFGWIETGSRAVRVGVIGEEAALATGTLEVDCAGGAGTSGEGRIGAWD